MGLSHKNSREIAKPKTACRDKGCPTAAQIEYFVTNFTCLWDVKILALNYAEEMEQLLEIPRLRCGVDMKLPIILASVVAYVVLATVWICYAELVALY